MSKPMQVNDLVKSGKFDGIGCISKVLSNRVHVNIGRDSCKKLSAGTLTKIDTHKCKTVSYHKFQSRILDDKGTLNYAIVGNELMHYVGIGWISHGVVTEEDLKKYPRVI